MAASTHHGFPIPGDNEFLQPMADLFLTLVAIFLLAPAVGVAFQVAGANDDAEPAEVVTVTLSVDGALSTEDGSTASWTTLEQSGADVDVLLVAAPGVSAASLIEAAQDAASRGLGVQLSATPSGQ